MGDRRKSEEKKNMVGLSRSEYPEDIPTGRKHQMSLRDMKGKIVLREVVDQGSQAYCWNIASSRMISAYLYIRGKVDSLLPLSARHLFAGVDARNPNGSLKDFEPLKDFLVNEGMIQEKDCRCVIEKEEESGSSKSNSKTKKKSSKLEKAKADPCFGKMKGKETFKIRNLQIIRGVDEKKLIDLLHDGRIAASISIQPDFKQFKGDGIHRGYTNSSRSTLDDHLVLLTGYGTMDGVNYWEFQNSYGLNWGENGFGKLIRQSSRKKGEPSLINVFIYPELLD